MVYLLFLLIALPFSLALPQGTGGITSSRSINVATGAALVSATTAKGVTTTTKKATTTTPKATTITTKKVTTTNKATTTQKGVTTTPPKPTTTRTVIDCSDKSWKPTVDAWIKEKVDQNLKAWWESKKASGNFVSEFGKAFGDFELNLACGVDTEDQCVNPSCKGLFYTLFLPSILSYLF